MCGGGYAIVELLPEPEPVCTWPGRPGVLTLSKGWVARDPSGIVSFFNKKPTPNLLNHLWSEGGNPRKLSSHSFTDLPVFNPDLPWTEHIVEVGWEETVVVKDEWNGTTMEVAGKMCEPMDYVEIGPKINDRERIHDGWVAQDSNEDLYWYEEKPVIEQDYFYPDIGRYVRLRDSEVIFPSSWPWDQRIVRIVGNQIVRDE